MRRSKSVGFFAFLLLLLAAESHALATGVDWLQFSGFLSQCAIYTSDNNFFGNTNDSVGFEFREIGAVFTLTPTPTLRFSTQLLSRKAGGNDDGHVEIDHATVSYEFLSGPDWSVSVQAGRLKSLLGWYNETRDVPFTRPSIFLPSGIYGERARNSYFFQDGLMLRGEWRNDVDTLSWHIGAHRPKIDTDEIADIAPLDAQQIPNTDGKDSWSVGLVYDIDTGRMRLGVYHEVKRFGIDLAGDFNTGNFTLADFHGGFDLENRKLVLSFEYNFEKLSFTTEYSTTKTTYSVFSTNPSYDGVFPDAEKLSSPAYYYQATYRPLESWDIFVRYDRFIFDGSDPYGNDLAANPLFNFQGFPSYAFYAIDYTMGAGWHPDTDWLLRLEWHNVEGTAWVNSSNNTIGDLTKYWDMLALQLSYRF